MSNFCRTFVEHLNTTHMKHYIFDKIMITNGHELGWLHLDTEQHIDPENLFMDKYDMETYAKDIVMDGEFNYTNYFFDDEWIEEWEQERDLCDVCDGEGVVWQSSYESEFANTSPCPECNDNSDTAYELSRDK